MYRFYDDQHQHYLVSGGAVIDSGDLEQATKLVAEHGFGTTPNSRLLALMNPAQAEVVSTFKAAEENATGIVAKHDYIPSAGAPAYLQPDNIVGQVAPEKYNGLAVQGSYGPVWVIQSDFIPEGYFGVVATYGPNSPDNAIGFRQHQNPAYQGIRIIPGATDYPLQDSFLSRALVSVLVDAVRPPLCRSRPAAVTTHLRSRSSRCPDGYGSVPMAEGRPCGRARGGGAGQRSS